MQKIILYLEDRDLTHASWGVINDAGTITETSLHGKIEDLASIALDKELIVIVPAQDILLTSVKIPKMSRQRLQQALPFALEEQLLSDINDLHFAMGTFSANNSLPVAIVSQQKMTDWINTFKQIGLSPSVFIPASLLAPLIEKTWSILIEDNIAIIRTDLNSGFACDKSNLQTVIESRFTEQAEQPEAIALRNYTPHATTLDVNDIKISEKNFPEIQLIEDMCNWAHNPPINLLQGPYLTKRKSSHSKKIWLLAGYLGIAWIGLLFVSHIISFFILHHQVSALDAGINHIYKKHFPEATSLIAPKQRMEEKLSQLSTQGHRNPLLLWLAYTGKALTEATGVRIDQLDYRNNQLTLSLSAPNMDRIDAFTHALMQSGLTIKQQSAILASGSAKCNLLITEGAKR
ncbi:MAG: type II secretion system protein GspL [Gammaproteobacteria bacterium]|nr:type II secretion system protein GspL [Gammaproteobacteria bacterium]